MDADSVEKEMINDAKTMLSVETTGKAQRSHPRNGGAPLHDESVVAVRNKFLDASDNNTIKAHNKTVIVETCSISGT